MTPAELSEAWGVSIMMGQTWAPMLTEACEVFDISTPKRLAAFVAQCGHESGCGRYVREIWGPTGAQRGYEGRADLGNVQEGDGYRYRGRGLIQVTGRANYVTARNRMTAHLPGVPDFEARPELLEIPRWAAMSAANFWQGKGLNDFADSDAFETLTRRINGGVNGLADRKVLWELAKKVFH